MCARVLPCTSTRYLVSCTCSTTAAWYSVTLTVTPLLVLHMPLHTCDELHAPPSVCADVPPCTRYLTCLMHMAAHIPQQPRTPPACTHVHLWPLTHGMPAHLHPPVSLPMPSLCTQGSQCPLHTRCHSAQGHPETSSCHYGGVATAPALCHLSPLPGQPLGEMTGSTALGPAPTAGPAPETSHPTCTCNLLGCPRQTDAGCSQLVSAVVPTLQRGETEASCTA